MLARMAQGAKENRRGMKREISLMKRDRTAHRPPRCWWPHR